MTRAATLLAALLLAMPAHAGKESDRPGELVIHDRGEFFSAEAKSQAVASFDATLFHGDVKFAIFTFNEIPEAKRDEFRSVNANNRAELGRFFEEWTKELANAEGGRPIAALLYFDGKRYFCRVVSDSVTASDHGRGFSDAKAADVAKCFITALDAAYREKATGAALHVKLDPALADAVHLVANDLKNTTSPAANHSGAVQRHGAEERSVLSYICLGACVFLGVWFVIGLVRALFGGGGGGSGGGPGGGGFMSSLFGGLFGAMAGMWIYNSFFGGGSDLGAADSTAAAGGDWGDADPYDNGASAGDGGGDWGDDFGGGDWGGGDFGGGDW